MPYLSIHLRVKSEKLSVTLTHDPHLTTEQLESTHLPHTFLNQNTTPPLVILCPFIKCLFSVLRPLFANDRCPSHNSLRRKGDIGTSVTELGKGKLLVLESNGFRVSDITWCLSSLLLSALKLYSLKWISEETWKHSKKQLWAVFCPPEKRKKKFFSTSSSWKSIRKNTVLACAGY